MEEVKVEQVEGLEIYQQQDKAVIDSMIATARAYPRNIKKSVENAIATVTLDQETAQSCNYSLPRGGKTISGPSVHLAKTLAQTWGNMRFEAKVVSVDKTTLTSQGVAFDLESNVAIKVEVKRSIVGKHGRFNEDMITVTGNAANAIALRNAILSVIPKMVVDKVYNAALETITGDVSGNKIEEARTKLVKYFDENYKVTEKEILNLLGKEKLSQITKDNIVTLRGVAQAIKDGDTTAEYTFRPKSQKVEKDEESERISEFIEKAQNLEELEILEDQLTETTKLAWEAKYKLLSKKK